MERLSQDHLSLLPLSDTLQVLLPDAQDALFLRACLGNREAWQVWLRQIPSLSVTLTQRPRSRRLLPLLHDAFSSDINPSLKKSQTSLASKNAPGVHLAEASFHILRGAALWEKKRASRLQQILGEVLEVLRGVGVLPVLLNGAALAASVYPKFCLRHCHDIELLIDEDKIISAQSVLVQSGFYLRTARSNTREGPDSCVLLNRDGLPVTLRTRLWKKRVQNHFLDPFRQQTISVEIEGVQVPILAPMELLLHVCAHESIGTHAGDWSWIADVAMILRQYKPDVKEWMSWVRNVEENNVSLTVAVRMLGLSDRVGVNIPSFVLAELVKAARRSSKSEKEAALAMAQRISRQRVVKMMLASCWRSRLVIARWAVLRRFRRNFQKL